MAKKSKKVKICAAAFKGKGFLDTLRSKFIHTPATPFAAQMHEWTKIERLQRENHPVACFLLNDVPRYFAVKKMRLDDAIWWVKYRTMKKHNFHIVDTGLNPGYHDSDEILLHSSMAVLVDYVENSNHGGSGVGEKGLADYIKFCKESLNQKNWADWERKQSKKQKDQRIANDTRNLNGCKEILFIYHWWKIGRDVQHFALEKKRDENYSKKKFHFMRDERDPNALTGKEKKQYEAEMQVSFKLMDEEEALRQKDTDMIVRLAKVRGFMW